MVYRVFISHGWDDRWVARQMAESIVRGTPAQTFIDIFDVLKGDRIEQRIADELPRCDELVALLTSSSVRRNWVWTEIGGAWAAGKRIVGVLQGLTLAEVELQYGGMAALGPTNCLSLNDFDAYLSELNRRARGQF